MLEEEISNNRVEMIRLQYEVNQLLTRQKDHVKKVNDESSINTSK
jgi:hypothetical protein